MSGLGPRGCMASSGKDIASVRICKRLAEREDSGPFSLLCKISLSYFVFMQKVHLAGMLFKFSASFYQSPSRIRDI